MAVATYRTDHIDDLGAADQPLHAGIVHDLCVRNLKNTYETSPIAFGTAHFDGDDDIVESIGSDWINISSDAIAFPVRMRKKSDGHYRDLTIHAWAKEDDATGLDIEVRIYLRSDRAALGADLTASSPLLGGNYQYVDVTSTSWTRYQWDFTEITDVGILDFAAGSQTIRIPVVYPVVFARSVGSTKQLDIRNFCYFEVL